MRKVLNSFLGHLGTLGLLVALLFTSLLLVGCTKQANAGPGSFTENQPADSAVNKTTQGSSFPSVVIFGVSERGEPQFDYSGPDSLSFRYAGDSFTYQIKPLAGTPWATAKAEMKVGTNNDTSITIQSTSDRAYDIQFLGLSTNKNFDVEENKCKETVHVSPGDQKLTIDRFIIYTYDFAKDRERQSETLSR